MHAHPESADYLLLDEIVRELDGKLGGDMLPVEVVMKGVDMQAVRFMSHVRAARNAVQVDSGQGLAVAYMDGFTAGVMFQRAKAQGR